MSHKSLKDKNPVKEARDKAARDERARTRGLHSSNSSTSPNRSNSIGAKVKSLEEGSDQSETKGESSQLSPQSAHLRAHRKQEVRLEEEERAFRLSNWTSKANLPSSSIGISPDLVIPVVEEQQIQAIVEDTPIETDSLDLSTKTSSSSESTNSSNSESNQSVGPSIVNNPQLIVYNSLFEFSTNPVYPMAEPVDMGDPLIPVTMRPGQPDDRPTSVVSLPKFYGELGSDPDYHVREFLTSCNANNARTPSHWHAIFPTTLDGQARQWFHRQPLGHFANWAALKDAFIAKFRPVAYTDRLTEQMHDLQMITNESIDNYYGRMEDIILRLPNGHGFNDEMRKSIFIRGLIPFRLKAYVKEVEPATLDAAYQRAKLYENIYTTVNEAPVLSYINQPPVIVNQHLPMSNPVTYPPQIGVQSTIKIPNPPIVNNQLVTSRDKIEDEIVRQRLEDLTMQMGEL
jgi:hypothetical protein